MTYGEAHTPTQQHRKGKREACSAKGLVLDAFQGTLLANLVIHSAGEAEQRGDMGQGQTRGAGNGYTTF